MFMVDALASSYWPDGPGVNMFLANEIQKGAAITAAAAGPHTGFSADGGGEGSLKRSVEMTVEMSTSDL